MNDLEKAKNEGRSEAGLKEHRKQSKRRSKVKNLCLKLIKEASPTVYWKNYRKAESIIDGE